MGKSPSFSSLRAVGVRVRSPDAAVYVAVGRFAEATIGDHSRGEYPTLSHAWAGIELGVAIRAQPQGLAHLRRVFSAGDRRARAQTADRLAGLYAQRGSRGHVVIRELLWCLGELDRDENWQWALGVHWGTTAVVDESARRNRPGPATLKRWRRGAALIARRGAGLCLVENCEAKRSAATFSSDDREMTVHERQCRNYCDEHFGSLNKADQRAVEETCTAAFEALPSIEDRLAVFDAATLTRLTRQPAHWSVDPPT